MRVKYLADYVKVNLLNRLGFNEYEPSVIFTQGAGEKMKSCTAHIGYYPEKESVLIIIRAQDKTKRGKRIEWFFDTVSSEGVYNLEGPQNEKKLWKFVLLLFQEKTGLLERI